MPILALSQEGSSLKLKGEMDEWVQNEPNVEFLNRATLQDAFLTEKGWRLRQMLDHLSAHRGLQNSLAWTLMTKKTFKHHYSFTAYVPTSPLTSHKRRPYSAHVSLSVLLHALPLHASTAASTQIHFKGLICRGQTSDRMEAQERWPESKRMKEKESVFVEMFEKLCSVCCCSSEVLRTALIMGDMPMLLSYITQSMP